MSRRNVSENAIAVVLQRLEHEDAAIGAFVDVLVERAYLEASESDERLASGLPRRTLEGVPIGVKELFDVAGADGSYGSMVLAGRRAERDATIVTALRRAGAIVVGTTRSHEFGWGITTVHELRGSTRNPWNREHIAGGSSGGSAAAVAAGMVPLAIGTDTGGSVRIPAAFCGVLGLKTTFGRVSRTGSVPLAPSLDSPGFFAGSVALLAAAFSVSSGGDPGDPITEMAPVPLPVTLGMTDLSTLRFACPETLVPDGIESVRSAATEAVCNALGRLGMQPCAIDLPDPQRMLDAYSVIQLAEGFDIHSRLLGTYPDRANDYGPDVRSRLKRAESVTLAEYLAARHTQVEVRAAFIRAFRLVDVIVSAVGPCGPSRVDNAEIVSVRGTPQTLRTAMMKSTVPQNLAGLPSITCPVGLDTSGLPIGIQLTGAPWTEPVLLDVAEALEAEGTVAVRYPGSLTNDRHT